MISMVPRLSSIVLLTMLESRGTRHFSMQCAKLCFFSHGALVKLGDGTYIEHRDLPKVSRFPLDRKKAPNLEIVRIIPCNKVGVSPTSLQARSSTIPIVVPAGRIEASRITVQSFPCIQPMNLPFQPASIRTFGHRTAPHYKVNLS